MLVIASIVQAEGQTEDFPKIARAIYNRLGAHMKLQLDSTVNFVLKNDDQSLSTADIATPSPYNTYLHDGLPPGPIDSPGEDAINAVLSPAAGNWLYWVTVDPKTGVTKFTNSYTQFLQFKAELDRRTADEGGGPRIAGRALAVARCCTGPRTPYLDLDWTYEAVECDEAGLAGFVAGLTAQWAGLSLTMPLKTAVLASAGRDRRAEPARRGLPTPCCCATGGESAPTPTCPAWWRRSRSTGWAAAGPVGPRCSVPAPRRARPWSRLAAAGYSSAEVLARRPECGRRPGRDRRRGRAAGAGARLVRGGRAAGRRSGRSGRPGRLDRPGGSGGRAWRLPSRSARGRCSTCVYDPWPTPLAAAWAAAGGLVVGGLDLLVHQAVGQVRLMTRCTAGADELVAVLRPAGRAALAAR